MQETLAGLARDVVEYADLFGRPLGQSGVEADLDDYEIQQSLYEG